MVFGYPADGDVHALHDRLRERLSMFPYASCTLIGRDPAAAMFHAAGEAPFAAEFLIGLDRLFGLDAEDVLCYDDARRGVGRRVRIRGDRVVAARFAGDLGAASWLKDWLLQGRSAASLGRLLLAPNGVVPAGFTARGRVVCNCWNISEIEIAQVVSTLSGKANDALAALQASLKCGTQCGSCLPEVKRLLA